MQYKVQLDLMITFSEYASDIQKRGDLCKLVIIFRVGGGGSLS